MDISATEVMHNMKKLILSVYLYPFRFATATHNQQVNTLLTKQLPEHRVKRLILTWRHV
jgi:hypothetical protein